MAAMFVNDEPILNFDADTTITDATTKNVLFIRPDKTKGTWTGTVSGTDTVQYAVQSGEINAAGDWIFQIHVVLSNGKTYHGPKITQEVDVIITP